MFWHNIYSEIAKNPISLFALIGVIILIFVVIKVRKIKFTTSMIAQIGIALALSTILKIFRIYRLPQGGSITLGSMVPILLISLFYGPEIGYLTGFLYGVITFIMNPYVLHPIQVIFDYPLPFMALGVAGNFKDNKILGTSIALVLRFLCHFISGFIFFGSFAPGGVSPFIYSLTLNGVFMGIEGIICIVIIAVLPINQLYNIITKENQ